MVNIIYINQKFDKHPVFDKCKIIGETGILEIQG